MTAPAYQLEPALDPAEFIDVLLRSTLAERRPVNQPDVIRAMLEHADIVLTARLDRKLSGWTSTTRPGSSAGAQRNLIVKRGA